MTNRFLPILDEHQMLTRNASTTMFGFMLFPDDPQSAFHFARMLAQDASFLDRGLSKELSRATNLLLQDARKRKNQAHVAGHVALTIVEMRYHQMPTSLSRAIELTEYFAKRVREEFSAELPSSTRKIREHWNHFMPVGHYWAASLALPDLFLGSAESGDQLAEFLGLSERIESMIGASIDTKRSNWSPWRVPRVFADPDREIFVSAWKDEFKEKVEAYYRRNGN